MPASQSDRWNKEFVPNGSGPHLQTASTSAYCGRGVRRFPGHLLGGATHRWYTGAATGRSRAQAVFADVDTPPCYIPSIRFCPK